MTAGLALDCTQKKIIQYSRVRHQSHATLPSDVPVLLRSVSRNFFLWNLTYTLVHLMETQLTLKKRFKLFSSFQNNFSHCLAPAELFAFLCHVWNWISSCLRLLGAGKCNVRESVCKSKYLKYLNKLCMLQLIIALSPFSVVCLQPYS